MTMKRIYFTKSISILKPFFCLVLFFSSLNVYSDNGVGSQSLDYNAVDQEKKGISGVITDENGEPIVGANIAVKGTNARTITAQDGSYYLKVQTGQVLTVSFVGYVSMELKVSKKTNKYDVALKPDSKLIDEVVVTGYQTISKERATGSFAILTPEKMKGKLQMNVLDRMEGMVAGMRKIPGKNPEIRGTSTLFGLRTPLYVVDGIPFEGDINAINPADIVNITVLKDATAASIYGARSANGVIVISTRVGQKSKTRVNYNGSLRILPLPDRDYMNLTSSAELVDFQKTLYDWNHKFYDPKDRKSINEVYKLFYDHDAKRISDADYEKALGEFKGNDRYEQVKKELLRFADITHQHNLSFNGGTDFYKYALSLNYQENMPYDKEKTTQRLGFNIRNQFNFFSWLKADVGILKSNVNQDYDNGIYSEGYLDAGASYRMLRNADGTPAQWYSGKSQLEIDRLNKLGLQDETYKPLEDMNKAHYNSNNNYTNVNVGLNFKIIDGLNWDFRYQTEKTRNYSKQYYSKESSYMKGMINNAAVVDKNTGNITYNIPIGGMINEYWYLADSYTLRTQLNYSKAFAKHNIQALVGAERRKVTSNSSTTYKYGYDDTSMSFKATDNLKLQSGINDTEAIYGYFSLNQDGSFSAKDDRYVSFYGNGSYTFNDKYTLTGSIRMDQSNLFGTDPKYQYKPLWSIGGHYVALKNWNNWLDRLAFRLTYGVNGNISKSSGPFMIAMDDRVNSYTNEFQSYISTPPNPLLRWERTDVFNVGVDFNLFKNRLCGSVELYNKATSDLMGRRATDPTSGWSFLTINYGEMYNRGVELSLQSKNIQTKDFEWSSGFTFSYNKNKLTKIENSGTSAIDYYFSAQNREGYPMYTLFSIRYGGLNKEGFPMAIKADGTTTNDYSKLVKEDLVNSGTTIPPFSASLSNRFAYKGFDIELMFVFYGGHKLRDVAASYVINRYPILNYTSAVDRGQLKYWKNPGDENDPDMAPTYLYKNKGSNSEYNWSAADKHIQKGDYIKLRDVNIGYTFPNALVKKCYMQNLRLSVQMQNLCYWAANKKNLDPEAWDGTSLNPNRGTHYPATFSFGLSADF